MVALAARRARLHRIRFRRADRYPWDGHIQPAALRRAALGPDASAVAHDDLSADVETETHTRGVARGTIRRAIEEPEERVQPLLGDPDPFVGHGEPPGTLVDETCELGGLPVHHVELFGDPAEPLRHRRRPGPLAQAADSSERDLEESGHRGDRRLELVRRDRKEL